jgi:hypothetical protein
LDDAGDDEGGNGKMMDNLKGNLKEGVVEGCCWVDGGGVVVICEGC